MDDLGFWLEAFLFLLALGCFAVGVICAIIAVFLIRIMIIMIRMGPRIADEAAESGASLSKWWHGEPWPESEFEKRVMNRRWWKF